MTIIRTTKTPNYTIRSIEDDAGRLMIYTVPQDGERNISVTKIDGTQSSVIVWDVASPEAQLIVDDMVADLPANYNNRVRATKRARRVAAKEARLAQIEVEKASILARQTEITDEELRLANEVIQ